jgi:hypothetical protein
VRLRRRSGGAGLGRLTIFAKGNLDVRDVLHAQRIGDKVVWNGLNEIVRVRYPGTSVRVRHETWTRSDALLEAKGVVPADLAGRDPPLDAYPASSQFSHALFDADADVIVLSIQPDVMTTLVRHKTLGYLLCPNEWRGWSADDQAWLRENFTAVPRPDAAASMDNFARIIAQIRERSAAPILVFNLSPIAPGEWVHVHQGLEDIFSTRVRRFNLGLIELSQATGISVIDVDAIVARAGADRVKFDALHLNAEGCRLVAEAVVRVLDDLDCLPSPEGQPCG